MEVVAKQRRAIVILAALAICYYPDYSDLKGLGRPDEALTQPQGATLDRALVPRHPRAGPVSGLWRVCSHRLDTRTTQQLNPGGHLHGSQGTTGVPLDRFSGAD